MLMKIAQWLTAAILYDVQDEQQRLLCEYGCELWLYTVSSTLGLFLIGILLGAPLETVMMIAIFYLCQSNGGGYHANTHMKCFLTMACGLLVGLLIIRIPGVDPLLILACTASILILLAFPLCLHPNKRYLKGGSQKLKLRSWLVTAGIAIVIVGLRIFEGGSLFHACCIAVFLSAVSRLIAANKYLEDSQ